MAKQIINTGTIANDGTGDTLRIAGTKMNANFTELYGLLGDGDNVSTAASFDPLGLRFNGTNYDTVIQHTEPAASDITISFPNEGGTLVNLASAQTLSNKTFSNSTIDQTLSFLDQSADHQYNLVVSELTADRDITLPVLGANDVFTFNAATQTLTNKTLTSPTLSTPAVLTGILDANGANLVDVSFVASAVNNVNVANAATTNSPKLSSVGTDADINLELEAKGDGVISARSAVRYLSETIISTGQACDPGIGLTRFEAGGAITATIPDPTNQNFVGTIKILVNNNSIASDVTVTPATFVNGTSITIRHRGVVKLMWLDNVQGWFLAEPKIYPSSDADAMWFVT